MGCPSPVSLIQTTWCLWLLANSMPYRYSYWKASNVRHFTFQCIPCLNPVDLHSLGITHTDIKPDNIVLVEDAFVRITALNADGHFVTKVCHIEPSITRPFSTSLIVCPAKPPNQDNRFGWFPTNEISNTRTHWYPSVQGTRGFCRCDSWSFTVLVVVTYNKWPRDAMVFPSGYIRGWVHIVRVI